MNTTIYELSTKLGSDLSSRQRAAEFREQLLAVIGEADACVLNLSGVRSVSHSFADELFAVLIEDHGEAWFKEHLLLQGISPVVRQTILEAIQQRLQLCQR